MNRRHLLQQISALAAGTLVSPERAPAAGQLAVGSVLGVDWGLAFADQDGDLAPGPMTRISGTCPAGLSGDVYRNGPGKWRRPGGSAAHWFDGDGLVRAFRIRNGEASLAARFVDTAKRRADSAAGAMITPGFGTPGRPGAHIASADDVNPANTSVMPLGGELWALWEGGSPTVVNQSDLSTKGVKTLRSDLAHTPFLAHPRAEPDGDIWNLGVMGDKALVWRLGADGALAAADTIDLPCASYVHDFTASERWLIVVLAPLIRKKDAPAFPYIDGFSWRPDEPTRILVIDKADLGSRRIYELPAFFAFHFGPAWAEPDGTIRFDACASADPSFATRGGREILKGDWTPTPPPVLALITLPPDGQAQMTRSATTAEFPSADPARSGWPRALTFHVTGDASRPLFHGLATYNWSTHQADAFDFGPAHLVEEAVFAPRSDAGDGELSGWLLTTSVNLVAKASELHVFDANHVADGPLCSWRAGVALPAGLHAVFTPT
jgi:carotenoid cleavage dioxygenase-like enzyme